jgi:hypothetical protein
MAWSPSGVRPEAGIAPGCGHQAMTSGRREAESSGIAVVFRESPDPGRAFAARLARPDRGRPGEGDVRRVSRSGGIWLPPYQPRNGPGRGDVAARRACCETPRSRGIRGDGSYLGHFACCPRAELPTIQTDFLLRRRRCWHRQCRDKRAANVDLANATGAHQTRAIPLGTRPLQYRSWREQPTMGEACLN